MEMKRVVFLCSLLLICSSGAGNAEQTEVRLADGPAASGQSGAWKTCPFSITGMWRIEGSTRKARTLFYEFAPGGVVIISEYTSDVLPREYESIGGAKYLLDKPEAPGRLEFKADFRSGVIPWGKTSLSVVEYGDDSFVTADPKTQARTRWVRMQTRRCFLTFAARVGPEPSAFAMWTEFDGRNTKFDAFGLRIENHGAEAPIFGLIPDRLYREFEYESRKDSDVILRLELTEAEFDRSHKMFETWAAAERTAKLPYQDPYLNGMAFLKSVAENLNKCDLRLKLDAAAGAAPTPNSPQQMVEYVRMMRKKNGDSHVTDGMFPVGWLPAPPLN
jgi:hypothetical protein